MKKLIYCVATAVAISGAPLGLHADEPERFGLPKPESLFKHLGANGDGTISEDELPEDAPQPLKALLREADKNGDKTISLDEFTAFIKEHPPARPPLGMPIPGRMAPPDGQAGPPPGFRPPGFHGPGGLRKGPDPQTIFKQLDKDGDGKLTVEEFVEGTNKLHDKMMEPREPMGPGPGPGRMPPPMFGMMLPPPMPGMFPPFPPRMPGMGMPPGGTHGPRPGGPMPVARVDRSLPTPSDARLEALEEKLKAIEAKIEGNQ